MEIIVRGRIGRPAHQHVSLGIPDPLLRLLQQLRGDGGVHGVEPAGLRHALQHAPRDTQAGAG